MGTDDSVHVISRKRLREFAQRHPDAKPGLDSWFHEAEQTVWRTPAEVKRQYARASILKGGRVVFDIAGNKYRLVAQINYHYEIVYIRFVGTHAEHDKIDVETI